MVTAEPQAITDEGSAVAHVSSLLSEPERPPEEAEETPQATQEAEAPEGDGETEPAEAEATQAAAEDPDPEAEPDSESVELPDTLAGLAEALGVGEEDLAQHLKIPVKVNGQVSEVTLADARKGHQLEADYTQKTMKVAEQERALQAQAQQMTERWQQETQRLAHIIREAESLLEDAPSLERILDEEGVEAYERARLKQERQEDKLDQAREAQAQMQQQQARAVASQMATKRAEEQRHLVEKMGLDKPEKITVFEGNLSKYLQEQGYTAQHIEEWFDSPFDHRHIIMMDKARKYDALMKGKKTLPKRLQNVPKMIKPGVQTKQTGQDKLVASKDRLKRLKTRGSKQQQTAAAVDFVKGLI